ncbi:MAG TPA: extradiol ring-cleavage dioxygenase [Chloroflexota bacterium]|nr:extradiol ring-cleavage dioxygenase [Chloroflexota bacterium]
MGTIAAGLASSHAFTLIDPETWDERRAWNRGSYKKRYGVEPPQQPQVDSETLHSIRPRYQRIRSGLERLRDELAVMRPDALIVIGDDQDENYHEDNMPQFAIYTGDRVRAVAHGEDGGEYACHAELAQAILEGCVAQGFDLAYSRQFPNGELKSHAHGPPLQILTPERDIPIVPLFVNAIHFPAPEPARCHALGQAIARVIKGRPAGERVAIYASGGLSHFTAGYPWKSYSGPYTHGAICTDFDHSIVDLMRQGKASKLAELTSKDLLANGDIEFRSWLILLGALGDRPATEVMYEPFYRAIMGMAVGFWSNGAH